MRKIIRWIALACFTTLLAACGGGGGGGGTASSAVASTEIFQIKAAWVNYVTDASTHAFNVSGTSSGTPFTGSGTVTTNGAWPATFEYISGFMASSAVNGTLYVNGNSYALNSSSTIYTDSNYIPTGASTAGDYVVVQGTANIPATGKVGDSGIWYTANRYFDTGKTVFQGTQTASFSLSADTATTALLKVTLVNRNTGGAVVMTETLTFRVTPAGALTWLSDNTTNSTTTVNITY